jgi:hypothetical protein
MTTEEKVRRVREFCQPYVDGANSSMAAAILADGIHTPALAVHRNRRRALRQHLRGGARQAMSEIDIATLDTGPLIALVKEHEIEIARLREELERAQADAEKWKDYSLELDRQREELKKRCCPSLDCDNERVFCLDCHMEVVNQRDEAIRARNKDET